MHLRSSLFVLLIVISLFSCSEDDKSSRNIAKVGDSVLTEEYLNNSLGEYKNQNKFREEFINDWIEKEILFQEARDAGILESEEYLRTLEKSKKELAAALIIKKYLEENRYEPTTEELKNFYEKYKQDFTFVEDNYKINRVYFNNIDAAVRFRKLLIDSDWKKALNSFRGEESLLKEETLLLLPSHKIETVTQFKVISNLLPFEVSIILQEEPSKFVIVQLIEKFEKGTIPAFEMITDLVKERFMILKNKELVRSYLTNLIDDHNIEIKRYTE